MIRTSIAIVPYLLLIAAVIGGLLSYAGDQVTGLPSGTAAIGGPFALLDQTGAPRTDRDFAGQYLLVYFGYTYCPDVCPTTLAVIGDAMKRLGPAGQRITPIFVTVDPARDTPGALKTYLANFGSRFVGLTGTSEAINRIEKEYSVYAVRETLQGGGYAMTHSNTIYLMGPNGKFITHYEEEIGPDKLADDLRKQVGS